MRYGVISESDAYALVRLSTLDLISTGVTTVLDWSHAFTPEFVIGNIRALNDSGLRFIYAYYGSKKTVDNMRGIKKELIDPNPMASFQVASHPTMAMLSELTAMARLARNLSVPLNVHLLEDISSARKIQLRL
jgi:5-methylthioadenosine/S-adenosylhomocysteine deaminase